MRLDHVNIKAPMELLERERRFFRDVLGLREGERPSFSSRGYWLYAGDHAVVHLSESTAKAGREGGGAIDHVAFRSTGLAGLIETLEIRKIDYSTVYLPDLNLTQVFLKAPSNTRIEINFVNERLRSGEQST